MDYIAFFFAIKHEHYNYLKNTLDKYEIGKFLIAQETDPKVHIESEGQHFHFLVQMTIESYAKYSKVIRDKFKLRGRATEGKPRQYGRIKDIKDLDRMAAYTLKDGDYYTNMDDKDLDKWYKLSFKKDLKQKHYNKLMKYIDEYPIKCISEWPENCNEQPTKHFPQSIALAIINYYRTNCMDTGLTPSIIRSYVNKYLLYYSSHDDEQIYHFMFGKFGI